MENIPKELLWVLFAFSSIVWLIELILVLALVDWDNWEWEEGLTLIPYKAFTWLLLGSSGVALGAVFSKLI